MIEVIFTITRYRFWNCESIMGCAPKLPTGITTQIPKSSMWYQKVPFLPVGACLLVLSTVKRIRQNLWSVVSYYSPSLPCWLFAVTSVDVTMTLEGMVRLMSQSVMWIVQEITERYVAVTGPILYTKSEVQIWHSRIQALNLKPCRNPSTIPQAPNQNENMFSTL